MTIKILVHFIFNKVYSFHDVNNNAINSAYIIYEEIKIFSRHGCPSYILQKIISNGDDSSFKRRTCATQRQSV